MNNTKQEERVIRVYLRVSSERQEKEETIKTQKSAVERYISLTFGSDLNIQHYYMDDGYSGEYLQRPNLAKLRADLVDESWNTLVMYAPDRLSRDFNHGNLLTDEILKSGKDIFYVEGPSPSTESKLITRIMSAISDDDKEKTLRKLYNGKLQRANSNVINNSTAPYGYELIPKQGSKSSSKFVQTHLIINEEEAKVVRMIFNWVAEDRLSTRQVVLKLKELGVQPRKSKRGVWNTSTLNTLLKNETYIGRARFRSSYAVEPERRLKPQQFPKVHKTSRRARPKEEWIYIEGESVPAILEGAEGKKLFEKAQQQLSNNRRESTMGNKKQTAYLLGGRIRCTCGYTRNRSGSEERKNIYYTCASAKSCFPEKPCQVGGVNTRIADEEVWKRLVAIHTDPIELSKAVKAYYDTTSNKDTDEVEQSIEIIESQIQKLEKEKERMFTIYRKGLIEVEELEKELAPIKRLLKTVAKKREVLELKVGNKTQTNLDENLLDKIVLYAPDALSNLSFEDRREIILDSISNIVAKPGTLDVSGSLELQEMILLTDRNKLKLKGNKANIATPYYVYLKPISRNCWAAERREIDAL
jgi:site-specific DNA recombinase